MDTITDRVYQAVADHFGIEKSEVTSNQSFTDDYSATPLEITDFFMAIEKMFGVEIPTLETKKLTTISKLIEYLEDNTDEF